MKLKSKKIQEVLDALDQQEPIQKWNVGFYPPNEDWGFAFKKLYYDTDYYHLWIGRLYILYGPYGLPRILRRR